MPPHYDALTTDKDRRNEPDTELLPGAILRLTCAEWWKRKLWLLRCEWREETTPRRLSGFQKNITLSEPGRVKRVSRTARENTRFPEKFHAGK
ncbi:replication endonuclease [Escherichia coli]|uniref:replication endonuclease n=1 Tax=Escherichia coli TaxID=562 RepID=UPI003D7F5F48